VSFVEPFGKRMHTRGVGMQLLDVVTMTGVIVRRLLQPRVSFEQLRVFGGKGVPFRFQCGIHVGPRE
jgi:hypothetical protein